MPFCIESKTLTRPAPPAPVKRCPILDFTLPSADFLFSLLQLKSENNLQRLPNSTLSPAGVPVA